MPKWAPVNNDVPSIAELISYIADQVISQVTSGTRPSGVPGEMIFETDVENFRAFDGGTWQLFGGVGTWPVWTPVITQSGVITTTVTYSRYYRIGTYVVLSATHNVTSAGVANNAVTWSLPITAGTVGGGWGTGYVRDASGTALVVGKAHVESTSTATLLDATQSTNVLRHGQTGAAFAAALASGDSIHMGLIYEAAS